MAAILPRSVIANQRARWCGNPFLPLAALVLQFVHIVTARRENCGLPLPVARRVKQTCRWHVCSQSGEQALLATWKKKAGRTSRSRRLRGPSRSRPGNGKCGKADSLPARRFASLSRLRRSREGDRAAVEGVIVL